MEVYIRGIPFSMEQSKLKELLASTLHSAAYVHHAPQPLNFDVRLHRRRSKEGLRSGILTVPTEEVGEQFLREYGGSSRGEPSIFGAITFECGRKPPNTRILNVIRGSPYNPSAATSQSVYANDVAYVAQLQFGWVCSDEEFSVEWEKSFPSDSPATLTYVKSRREFRMTENVENQARSVAIRVNQVYWAAASPDQAGESSIFFYLNYLPSFEVGLADVDSNSVRTNFASFQSRQVTTGLKKKSYRKLRLRRPSFEDDTHLPIAHYTSIAIRMVCRSAEDVEVYGRLCRTARLPIDSSPPLVDRRELFSEDIRNIYRRWIRSLDFAVAFQIEGMLSKWLLNMREAVEIVRPVVNKIALHEGTEYAGELLADLKIRLEARYWYSDRIEVSATTIEQLLSTCRQQLYRNRIRASTPHPDDFFCRHIRITPSAVFLDGPFPERSNRVIRLYWEHRDNFIRVHFTDESGLAYRFDSEINIESLVDRRVKRFLDDGVNVAGKHFDFLGYSQSALKSQTVWFVSPFETSDGQVVDATTIVAGLGEFAENPYDPMLIHCPARYAARISQAFTTTESSITVAVEDMEIVPDIMDSTGTYSFTDGNGTMSLEVARDIAAGQRLKGRVRRAWRMHDGAIPRVLQVRIAGSKGMLHVDHRLDGRKIRLPKSMVKFDAPSSNRVEIAQLFEEPSPFYLNRPMIMLLEGLGVPCHVFQTLQDNETRAANTLMASLKTSGWLLDRYSLGNSFKLPYVIQNLCQYGVSVTALNVDGFWARIMKSTRTHILRELKYHARIPVSGGWTLVGVADMYGQLKEGEIYACVRTPDGRETYFEGRTLITRSPAIHPGDIQVVHAIGKPPQGSDLANSQLKNCVVFSTKGERPLPSYLGGGDLDGDMYNITNVPQDLLPAMNRNPALYAPAKRYILSRPSTMRDVAKFVTEFMLSDNVGVIADAWLKLADTAGILDNDCLRLAELNSIAVDYPKTGRPVPMGEVQDIVERRLKQDPDWYIPEAAAGRQRSVYQSQSALGKLFRAIDLTDDDSNTGHSIADSPEIDEEGGITLDGVLADIRARPMQHPRLLKPIRDLVQQYLSDDALDETIVEQTWNLFVAYISLLRGVSAKHVLSTSRSSMLVEEDIIIGTVSAKCAQTRKRDDLVSRLREQTAMLVDSVYFEISEETTTRSINSDEHGPHTGCLAR